MTKRTSKKRTSKKRTSRPRKSAVVVGVQSSLLKVWDKLHLAAGSMTPSEARKADKAASLVHQAYMTLGHKHVSRRR